MSEGARLPCAGVEASERVTWSAGGVPLSPRFGEAYHSVAGGLGQARAVFLGGNRLPERWRGREHFVIGELGFGTGLNLLATALAAECDPACPARLDFVSFEHHPVAGDAIVRAAAPWPELADHARSLASQWPQAPAGTVGAVVGKVRLEVVIGDARETLAAKPLVADAWYLDGFSPARNPQMWGADLMRLVHDRTAPGGTFATYTAAGAVRRNLAAAGFAVERVAGFGGKRERLEGRRDRSSEGA
ncbi:MAG: tRNA (5-methylaminomethyl-2-thiouridine)(34)-methyltransferase MnmD [Rhizobiales bacterium]|nr:tRNA (5-methylaminomethyl-2-thiouridine)(34)-methyltransferase MnmD [Hyphomicrobiales bacterium]